MEICILLNVRYLIPNVTYVIVDDNYLNKTTTSFIWSVNHKGHTIFRLFCFLKPYTCTYANLITLWHVAQSNLTHFTGFKMP